MLYITETMHPKIQNFPYATSSKILFTLDCELHKMYTKLKTA